MSTLRTLISRLLPPRMRCAAIWTEVGLLDRLRGTWLAPLAHRSCCASSARVPKIDIEVTSSCDADCIMSAAVDARRAQGPMALPLFEAIVDERCRSACATSC